VDRRTGCERYQVAGICESALEAAASRLRAIARKLRQQDVEETFSVPANAIDREILR